MKPFKPFRNSEASELDLRKELNQFLFGSNQEQPKGQLIVLRRMRRAEDVVYPTAKEDLLICDACLESNLENEPNIHLPCEKCDGEGYLFDEEIVVGYKTSRFGYQDVEKREIWGKNTFSASFFYVEFHESLSRYDKLIEPVIDLEGKIATPMKAVLKHNIHMAERFRSDVGRTEFWRVACWSE